MTAYPEPPPPTEYPSTGPLQASVEQTNSDDVRPELPSSAWPWLVGAAAIAALSLQTWSLLALLKAGKNESEFQARVAAWESANENRQEAIDTWNSIEQQASKNVDQLREQSSLLRGTIDSLQKQRDQLIESTTSQTKTLASLQKEIETADIKLDSAKTKMQAAELAASNAEAARSQTEGQNAELIEQGNRIKMTLAQLVTDSAKADAKVKAQEELVTKSQAELESVQVRIAQFDTFLQQKMKTAAEYRLQQEKSAEIAKELEAKAEELRKQKAAVAKATSDLESLNQQLQVQVDIKDKTDAELSALKANVKTAEASLEDLRDKERELLEQISTMTSKLNTIATAASKSLAEIGETAASTIKEMAVKAAEVREAVKNIQVPAGDESASPPEETDGDES